MSDTSMDTRASTWTPDIILILENLLDNVTLLHNVHKNNYMVLQQKLFMVRIPIICISAINSIIAVGLTVYISQNITSSINCLLSLITGILGSLELFLKIQTNLDNEFQTYQHLKILGIKISKELKLDPENRATEALVFLNEVASEYENIFESSIITSFSFTDKLFEMKKVERSPKKISNPMLNGNIQASL